MRRRKTILFLMAGAVMALCLDVMLIEPNRIEVNEMEIHGTGTDMSIGLVADFQRRDSDPAFVQRAVDMMNSRDLDIVLIAGDFIDKSPKELPSVGPLRELEAEHGVFGVLGNHDYNVYFLQRDGANMGMAEKVKEFIEEGGTVRILRNESLAVGGVVVIGLDSYWAGLRDEQSAFAGVADRFRILLAHNQDGLEIDGDVADLYLFGHTHCGQVRLPFFGSVPKMMGFEGDYDYRHNVVNGADVYTTCGLAPAPRLLNPPEVTIINLRA